MTVRALALGVVAGAAVLGVAGPPRARPAVPIRPPPPETHPRGALLPTPAEVAVGGAAALVGGLLAPPLAVLGLAAPLVRRRVAARRSERGAARAVAVALPDAVDLFLLCAGGGLSLPLAHPLVAARVPAPVGDALRAADAATVAGTARADALLAALAPLGDRAAAVARVLVDHLRYGVPLVPGLERLDLELRLDRRRRAEEEARRVPLRLLAPLLTCVLPAFGLLTVVPLLVASLRSLPT